MAANTGHQIKLSDLHLEQMQAWSREQFPREACGLLLGRRDQQRTEVLELTSAPNRFEGLAGEGFELEALHLVQAEGRARARGLGVVGLWHSHPGQAAVPSHADAAGALGDWSYPILALKADGTSVLRSWRYTAQGFREERLLS